LTGARTPLARLSLLRRVTRAIRQRQDLDSLFPTLVRRLERHLPADFACLCRYDDVERALIVQTLGADSRPLALDLALPEKARILLDENGFSRCAHGALVCQPDTAAAPFPFQQRLARGGLGSLAVSPLQVDGKVFGALLVARRRPAGFASGERAFLRQLSEHVALAVQMAQLHAALQAAADDLRQSQQAALQQERLRALGQMASGIAHDINNALSPVAIYTETLLAAETGLSPAGRGQLEVIRRAVEDVGRTIARMRGFYRQREPRPAMAPVQLNSLAGEVLDLTRARWRDMAIQRGAVIEVRTDQQDDLPRVLGLEGEIRDALTNLVFNAIDAMPRGGVLTLRTSQADTDVGRAVRIEVADTGVGMQAETRRRCLDPFFTTKGERGTGLGLSMVYGVAQRHAAELDIQSTLGEGTTVSLTFASLTDTDDLAPDAADAPTARLRLLLVDDDPAVLKALGDALGGDGHLVTAAHDGSAGIDAFAAALQGERFDTVITDLGMPHLDGRQVAAAVKVLSPGTPVILLTGWGNGVLSGTALPPHIDLVLGKPPKLREIRAALVRLAGDDRS